MQCNLSTYNNDWYKPGSKFKRGLWYLINCCFIRGSWNMSSNIKIFWLRVFGATVGKGVIIRPAVHIKYPWKLNIGNHCWLGESVWIDNLDQVTLEDNVCVSQGAYLLCGNHNYKSSSFDLMTAPIYLHQGSWIGAKAVVGPGVTSGSHAVLSLGAVATKDLEPYTVYSGNPAIAIHKREILE